MQRRVQESSGVDSILWEGGRNIFIRGRIFRKVRKVGQNILLYLNNKDQIWRLFPMPPMKAYFIRGRNRNRRIFKNAKTLLIGQILV